MLLTKGQRIIKHTSFRQQRRQRQKILIPSITQKNIIIIMMTSILLLLMLRIDMSESFRQVQKQQHYQYPNQVFGASASTPMVSLRCSNRSLRQRQRLPPTRLSLLSSSSSERILQVHNGGASVVVDVAADVATTVTSNLVQDGDEDNDCTNIRSNDIERIVALSVADTSLLKEKYHQQEKEEVGDSFADVAATSTTSSSIPTLSNHETMSNTAGMLTETTPATTAPILMMPTLWGLISIASSYDHKKSIFIALIAGMAGFTDIVYSMKYGCYVNMMTGNTIKGIRSVMNNKWIDGLFYATLLFSYTLGAVWVETITSRVAPTTPKTMQKSKTIMTTITANLNLSSKKLNKNNNIQHQTMPPAVPEVPPICVQIVPLVWLLFTIADIVSIGCYSSGRTTARMMYPFDVSRFGAMTLSMAYGILNTVTAEVSGGGILYALTGHFTKFGKGITKLIPMLLLLLPTTRPVTKQEITTVTKEQQQQPPKLTSVDETKIIDLIRQLLYHSRIIFGFMIGVVLAIKTCSCLPTSVVPSAMSIAMAATTTASCTSTVWHC